jgi:hypothetical protein
MMHFLEDGNFAGDSKEVALVSDFALLEDFDRNFEASGQVCARPDLPESALAENLAQPVLPDQPPVLHYVQSCSI